MMYQKFPVVLPLPEADPLGVLSSTALVVQTSTRVQISLTAIESVATQWSGEAWPEDVWDTNLHFYDGTAKTLNWMVLLDALNFCFWGWPGEDRWQVEWHNTLYNGYAALAAALTRGVEEGHPLWDAEFLAMMDAATLAQILRPTTMNSATTIPLFSARLRHTREAGRILRDKYQGNFSNLIEQTHGNAVVLTKEIAQNFSSFYDVSLWQEKNVVFLKRAQILTADIVYAFSQQGIIFDHVDNLTAFADYKVPQLLRRLGILVYAPDLQQRIATYQPIQEGSADEVAIRAATVWAVELLRLALAARGHSVDAVAIDHRLWNAGQTTTADEEPYHRTITVYY